jgi:hypothetical protein
MWCVCVVTALWLGDMYCARNRCRCGCGDDAVVSVYRMGAAAELWLHALAGDWSSDLAADMHDGVTEVGLMYRPLMVLLDVLQIYVCNCVARRSCLARLASLVCCRCGVHGWLFIARGAVSCAGMQRRMRGSLPRAAVAAAVGSAAPRCVCRRLRRVGDVQRRARRHDGRAVAAACVDDAGPRRRRRVRRHRRALEGCAHCDVRRAAVASRAMIASLALRCGAAVWCCVLCGLSSFRTVDAALLCVCVYELSCRVGCAGTLRVTALARSLTGVV